jgi:hypothetical protein
MAPARGRRVRFCAEIRQATARTSDRRAWPSAPRRQRRRSNQPEVQSIAQERSHLLMLRDHVDRGLPPPCRRGRSILFRHGAPLRKFAGGPLELKFCSWMHLRLGVAILWSASLSRDEVRRSPKAERAGHLKNALTSSARRSALSVPRILASLGTLI